MDKPYLHNHLSTPVQPNQDPRCNIRVDNLRGWQLQRAAANRVAEAAAAAGYQAHAQRMRDCGHLLGGEYCPHCGRVHITRGNSCRVRLCPICGWRLTAKLYTQLTEELAELQHRYPAAEYIWLTLTLRNGTDPAALREDMRRMAAAWTSIARRRTTQRWLIGAVRKSELKLSMDGRTYNQHIHVLAAVHPVYWSGKCYLSKARWAQMWREAAGADYAPNVDVRKVRGDATGAAEVATYAVKPQDLVTRRKSLRAQARAYDVMATTLRGLRLYGWSGEWRAIRRDLAHGDVETMSLDDITEGRCITCGTPLEQAMLRMSRQDYEVQSIIAAGREVYRRGASDDGD